MYLTRFGVMLAVHPPLPLDFEIMLEVQKQINRRHGASGEEMRCHPTLLAALPMSVMVFLTRKILNLLVIRRGLMCKNMHEKLAASFQSPADLGHQRLIVFHVLKKLVLISSDSTVPVWDATHLDGHDSVEGLRLKFIVDNVACDHCEIGQTPLLGLSINVFLLRLRVRERSDLGVRKDLCKIKRARPPAAATQSELAQA